MDLTTAVDVLASNLIDDDWDSQPGIVKFVVREKALNALNEAMPHIRIALLFELGEEPGNEKLTDLAFTELNNLDSDDSFPQMD